MTTPIVPNRPPQAALDSVNDARQPFGLPTGSVRGLMALFICGFFWMVLLWPGELGARPVLGHFFLLALVLMAFASSRREGKQTRTIPLVLRFLFVGGSVLVIGYCMFDHPDRLQTRLTPNAQEFHDWWGPFLATMFAGFAFGLFLRFVIGRENHIFQTIRAWFSVVGLVMLAIEFGLFAMIGSSESKPEDFLRIWQVVEVGIISAYFGTRA